ISQAAHARCRAGWLCQSTAVARRVHLLSAHDLHFGGPGLPDYAVSVWRPTDLRRVRLSCVRRHRLRREASDWGSGARVEYLQAVPDDRTAGGVGGHAAYAEGGVSPMAAKLRLWLFR